MIDYPGGPMGLTVVLIDPGPFDMDNGVPDLSTGGPPSHNFGSGVKKNENPRHDQ